MPGAEAVTNEAGLKVFGLRVESGQDGVGSVVIMMLGGKKREVGGVFGLGVGGFGGSEKLFDGGRVDIVVGVDEPEIFTFGFLSAEIADGRGATR